MRIDSPTIVGEITLPDTSSGHFSGSFEGDGVNLTSISASVAARATLLSTDATASFADLASDSRTSDSSSVAARATELSADATASFADLASDARTSDSASVAARATTLSNLATASFADLASNARTATSASHASTIDDGLTVSFATLDVTGDLTVDGTASFAYLQSVTGSAKIIGDSVIILNNNTPAERYAGIVVQDSGSTSDSASFLFDGQTNDWFYEYTDDGGANFEYAVGIFGPEYDTKGSPTYLTSESVVISQGGHHVIGSPLSISDTTASLAGLFSGSFEGDGSNLTGVAPIEGTGITVTGTTVSTNDSEIVHDDLSGFVANEHIDHTTVEITAGSGLTGGGTIAATRTLNIGAGTGITVNADDIAIGQDVATSADVQFNSLGIGTAAPTTTGLIRATNDVVAYYSSDKRLKDNIQPIEDALGKVEAMGGYSFDWNDKQEVYEGHDVGVIAQEVQDVLPELVETRDSGFLAVKYEKLTAVLIEAVKELSARVKALESK